MRTVHVVGSKGGVGTSVVSVLVARTLRAEGHTVSLVDASGDHEDLHAILGLPSSLDGPTFGTEEVTVQVIDHGTSYPSNVEGDTILLVVRNCFLSMRRALGMGRPDGLIVLTEPNRSLDARDVRDCMGLPILIELAVDPAVTRLVDAGLLGSAKRFPRIPVNIPAPEVA